MLGRFLEVRVDATINKGNYESEKVGVTYAPEESEDIYAAIEACRAIVYGTSQAATGKVEATVKEKEAKPKTTKAKDATTESVKANDEKKSEKVDTKAEEKAAKGEEKAKAKVAAKFTAYDRENGAHKKKLSALLTEKYPTWKTEDKLKNNALSASQKLHEAGTLFIDPEGVVSQEFLDKLTEIMEG